MTQNLNLVSHYILIVDDDKDDHFFLKKAIIEIIPQTIVESLYDGTEALEYLDHCTVVPNLIFLDLNMPKLSGKDTISLIRKNESLNKVPVIILTTSRSEAEEKEIMALGANAFYSKPADAKDLFKIVEEVKEKWL